ncbi:CDGSH iron-sulfur domain-containing protein [Aquimarina addita]
MDNNIRGGDAPIACQLEANKNYAWCSCGHSKDQPFCDGTHRKEGGTPPKIFTVEENQKAYICSCKLTKNPPFCDGSHS